MKLLKFTLLSLSIVTILTFAGCGSSDKTTEGQDQKTSTPVTTSKSGEQPSQGGVSKSDTLNVNVQNAQKPPYDQSAFSQSTPTGKFAVQIGAYKMADNAERVASLARERFKKNVYTIPDKVADLYKVMVGDFGAKDEARRFRDEMVQQYPS